MRKMPPTARRCRPTIPIFRNRVQAPVKVRLMVRAKANPELGAIQGRRRCRLQRASMLPMPPMFKARFRAALPKALTPKGRGRAQPARAATAWFQCRRPRPPRASAPRTRARATWKAKCLSRSLPTRRFPPHRRRWNRPNRLPPTKWHLAIWWHPALPAHLAGPGGP